MRFPLNCEVVKMSWKNAPPEVQAYFKNGARTAVYVRAVEPFVVSVTFDDGVTKEYDYTGKFTGKRAVEETLFKLNLEANAYHVIPKWLEFDAQNMIGKVVAAPTREDVDFPVEEHLIVELYSK